MSLQTQHNDHVIWYSEQNDEWEYSALDLSAKTLSALKTKINAFDAKERKLGDNGVELLYIGHRRFSSREPLAIKVRATMLDKGDLERYPVVWISHVETKQREKCGFHSLILNTQENMEVLAEADRLEKEAAAITKKAQAMKEAIPRITVDQVKAMALETKPE